MVSDFEALVKGLVKYNSVFTSSKDASAGACLGRKHGLAHGDLGVHVVASFSHDGLVFLNGLRKDPSDESLVLSTARNLNNGLFDLDESLDDKLLQQLSVLGSLRDRCEPAGTFPLQLL